jgi:hypothetical protein
MLCRSHAVNAPILRPAQPTAEAIAHARLRVWAADVRDCKPPYEAASPSVVAWAAALYRVLDTLDGLRRTGRAQQGLDVSAELLLARLADAGWRPPS